MSITLSFPITAIQPTKVIIGGSAVVGAKDLVTVVLEGGLKLTYQ